MSRRPLREHAACDVSSMTARETIAGREQAPGAHVLGIRLAQPGTIDTTRFTSHGISKSMPLDPTGTTAALAAC